MTAQLGAVESKEPKREVNLNDNESNVCKTWSKQWCTARTIEDGVGEAIVQ